MKDKKEELPGAKLCKNCGHMLAMHHAANLTDGAFVGKYIYPCPTSVYEEKRA